MSTDFKAEKLVLPVVPLLECREGWQVTKDRSRDPMFTFSFAPTQTSRHYVNAFEVRERFFKVRSTEDALRFFADFGPFELLPDKKTDSKRRSTSANPVKWSIVQRAQKDLEGALLRDSVPAGLYEFVFEQPLSVELRFRQVTPQSAAQMDDAGIIDCYDVAHALRASIFLSRMRGFPWKRCAREDCNQLFEQKSKHAKIYCSERCAHLEASNNYNRKKRKEK
jgi:hypothetical protein